VRDEVVRRLGDTGGALRVEILTGFATSGMQAAQGAAMMADGLAGGSHAELVDALGIRDARGTVLDHLFVTSREQAKKTLGIE
jgi:predicted butyrate kinase (DUF1464 family)